MASPSKIAEHKFKKENILDNCQFPLKAGMHGPDTLWTIITDYIRTLRKSNEEQIKVNQNWSESLKSVFIICAHIRVAQCVGIWELDSLIGKVLIDSKDPMGPKHMLFYREIALVAIYALFRDNISIEIGC